MSNILPAFTDFDPEIPRVNHQYYVGDGMILVQYNEKQSPLTTNQKHGFKTGLKMISNPFQSETQTSVKGVQLYM